MQIKNELRQKYKSLRRNIENKEDKGKSICEKFISSELFKNAQEILCYYPLGYEVNTVEIIETALSSNKKVALPLCVDKNGKMEFYYINSIADLKKGSFSIMEPDTEKCVKCTEFSNAVCLVPALSFDLKGYRLGYGKGYYDRFLEKFTYISAGLCYNELIAEELPHDSYDKKVDYIFTDNQIFKL